MATEYTHQDDRVMEYFYSAKQQRSTGCNNRVLTPEGWKPYSEMTEKGYHPNSTNKFGATAFFEGTKARIISDPDTNKDVERLQ